MSNRRVILPCTPGSYHGSPSFTQHRIQCFVDYQSSHFLSTVRQSPQFGPLLCRGITPAMHGHLNTKSIAARTRLDQACGEHKPHPVHPAARCICHNSAVGHWHVSIPPVQYVVPTSLHSGMPPLSQLPGPQNPSRTHRFDSLLAAAWQRPPRPAWTNAAQPPPHSSTGSLTASAATST